MIRRCRFVVLINDSVGVHAACTSGRLEEFCCDASTKFLLARPENHGRLDEAAQDASSVKIDRDEASG
jgi:hypothetical protein